MKAGFIYVGGKKVAVVKTENGYGFAGVENDEFKESDHPRDKGGKFTSKGGAGSGSGSKEKTAEKKEPQKSEKDYENKKGDFEYRLGNFQRQLKDLESEIKRHNKDGKGVRTPARTEMLRDMNKIKEDFIGEVQKYEGLLKQLQKKYNKPDSVSEGKKNEEKANEILKGLKPFSMSEKDERTGGGKEDLRLRSLYRVRRDLRDAVEKASIESDGVKKEVKSKIDDFVKETEKNLYRLSFDERQDAKE